ncbi:MAG: hypothetical protein ACXABD_01275 [Candidatus Thorarchaeota archaeon]|jgi:chromosome segregation ATPase
MADRAERFGMALGESQPMFKTDNEESRETNKLSIQLDKKLETVKNDVSEIKTLLLHLTSNLDALSQKISDVDRKCDQLSQKFDGEVLEECKKMGSHIDFVESVYDNVKHPLTFICNKVKHLSVGETPIEPTYQIKGPDDSSDEDASDEVD